MSRSIVVQPHFIGFDQPRRIWRSFSRVQKYVFGIRPGLFGTLWRYDRIEVDREIALDLLTEFPYLHEVRVPGNTPWSETKSVAGWGFAVDLTITVDVYKAAYHIRHERRFLEREHENWNRHLAEEAELEAVRGGTCTVAGMFDDDTALLMLQEENERRRQEELKDLRVVLNVKAERLARWGL